VLALAFVSYLGSITIGGNGFVAAFIGGLTTGAITRQQLTEETEFTEAAGTLSSLLVWTIFGAVFVVPVAFQSLNWREVLFALLSLTVIRMVPVALALRGKQLRPDTQVLMGWFGPRGLASVVFGLLAVDELAGAGQETRLLAGVVTWTILLSIVAHGLSAQPLAAWYSRRLQSASADLPELQDAPEMRVRQSALPGAAATRQPLPDSARPG